LQMQIPNPAFWWFEIRGVRAVVEVAL